MQLNTRSQPWRAATTIPSVTSSAKPCGGWLIACWDDGDGFALNGLYESLKAQNKLKEAEDIKKEFEAAWKYADSKLKYSRIDKDKRENLTLKIDQDSPNTLVYLASSMCRTK